MLGEILDRLIELLLIIGGMLFSIGVLALFFKLIGG